MSRTCASTRAILVVTSFLLTCTLTDCASPCLLVDGSCLELNVSTTMLVSGNLRIGLWGAETMGRTALRAGELELSTTQFPACVRVTPPPGLPTAAIGAIAVCARTANDVCLEQAELSLQWPDGAHLAYDLHLVPVLPPMAKPPGLSWPYQQVITSTPADELLGVVSLSGNSRSDLIGLRKGTNDLLILQSQRDGRFSGSTIISLPDPATIVLSDDVNYDGNPDVLSICGDCGSVYLSLGQVGGRFGPAMALLQDAGQLLTSAVLTDANSDGIIDLLLTNKGRLGSGFVVEFLGQRSLTSPFGAYGFLPPPGPSPVVISPAVFGSPPTPAQIALSDSTNGDTSFLDTAFVLDRPPTLDSSPVSIAAGDVDNDKRQDLVIAYNQGMKQGRLRILSQFSGGTFRSIQEIPLDCKPQRVWAADITRDGASDLLISCSGPTTFLYMLLGSVKSSPLLLAIDVGAPYGTPAILDANMDGWLDLSVPVPSKKQLVTLLGQL